jgi:hypothetical protein
MDPRTRTLFDVNIDDIIAALGWQGRPVLRALLGRIARGPALRFAREMTVFDDAAGSMGIRTAARDLLAAFVDAVELHGVHNIPSRGPVLLLSNHPGMTDTLALLSAIPRDDLLILAAERPFLKALKYASRSLLFIPDERARRIPIVRRAITHLRSGGALLTFPAGEIEPDPAVLPGAVEALDLWSSGSLVFVRHVPQAAVVPVIVSGVLAPSAQRHPVTLLRRKGADRERLAAMLQVLVHTLAPSRWRVRVRLDFLQPRMAIEFPRGEAEARAELTREVADFLRRRERA